MGQKTKTRPCACLLCVGQQGEHNELAQEFLNAALPMLERCGIDVCGAPDRVLLEAGELLEAAEQGRREGADFLLLLIGTWILADKLVDTARTVPLPAAVWGIPEAVSFSSVGLNVVHGAFDEMEIPHWLFYGFAADETLQAELSAFARAARVRGLMDGARLGMLGGRSIFAYPTTGDPNQIKQIFGVEVQHIDQLLLLERARAMPAERVDAALDGFGARFGQIDVPADTLDRSLRAYLALGDIRDQFELDFLAVKCLEEFIEEYTSCCAAVSLLNDDGTVTACQADLNAALSMYALSQLSGEAAIFGDVNTIDKATGVARMINCGTMAASLCGSRPVRWVEQYEYMGAGRGACPVFCCKEGPVTFGTFGRIAGRYVLAVAVGTAFEEPWDYYTQVRTWAQGFIRLEGDPMALLRNLRSNHSVVGYGDLRRELHYLGELLGVEVIEV